MSPRLVWSRSSLSALATISPTRSPSGRAELLDQLRRGAVHAVQLVARDDGGGGDGFLRLLDDFRRRRGVGLLHSVLTLSVKNRPFYGKRARGQMLATPSAAKAVILSVLANDLRPRLQARILRSTSGRKLMSYFFSAGLKLRRRLRLRIPVAAHSTQRTISAWKIGLCSIAGTSWPERVVHDRPLP
jgi:hypothetical protein